MATLLSTYKQHVLRIILKLDFFRKQLDTQNAGSASSVPPKELKLNLFFIDKAMVDPRIQMALPKILETKPG